MRLINADKLLLILNETYDEADAKYRELELDSFWGGCCSMIQEVIREVEKQSVPYDIDKVVKQLEEDCKMLKLGNDGFTVVALHIEEALKILKAGGNT